MMKRLILFFLLVALAAGAQKMTLYCATAGDIHDAVNVAFVTPFEKENPNVRLEWVPINVTDASTMAMDARIASGLPVHFYYDYMSRVAKYAIPKSAGGSIAALDLSKYIKDLDGYLPGWLESYNRDGQLAVPVTMHIIAQQINLSLLEKVGYALPRKDRWSLAEFEKMAGKVKAAKIPDTWPTLMFAENRSGDWMYMDWFASFGAPIFKDGKLALKPTDIKGLQVFKYWKWLQTMGYIPPEAAMMNDDHAIAYRDEGRLAAMGNRGVDVDLVSKTLVEQGILREAPKTVLYPYPRAPGVEKAPVLTSFELAMAFDSGKEAENAAAARLVWYFSNTAAQQKICDAGAKYPSRRGVKPLADQYWNNAYALMVEQGTLDVGQMHQGYDAIRGAMYPQLQKMFSGKASPAEAYVNYLAELQKVLDATR